ncbi:MAG: DUF2207 domain-containing protein [Armatimonadota bacterium]|nr:MAG: DUF2207 domain-containing protein [Armatimonadota bacterium]
MENLNWLVPTLVTVVGAGIWLRLYFRYGREPVPANPHDRLSEPPYEWTPVQVGLLWNQGRLGLRDMVASLIDLVRRGVLELRVEPVSVLELGGVAGVGEEYECFVRRAREKEGEATPAERYLIEEIIFRYAEGKESASLREAMVEGARDHRAACGRVERWGEIAREEPTPFPFVDPVSERMSARGTALGAAMLASYFLLGAFFPSVTILALVGVAGILTAGSGVIRRRSPEGAEALARWQAFRRHLAEVSSLSDAPPHSVAVWERYLVYAISLGVAGRVVDGFRLLHPTRANIGASADMYSSAFSLGGDPFCRAFVSLGAKSRPADGGR